MPTPDNSVSAQAREHDRVFHVAFSAARKARTGLVTVRPHRSITPLNVTPFLLAQAIVLPLVLCGLLLWGKPLILDFWRDCILFWASGLDLSFSLATQINESGEYGLDLAAANGANLIPGQTTLAVTALVMLLALGASLRMKGAQLPLKYPVRIVAIIQLITVAYFWLSPAAFPYSIGRHSEELMTIGYVVMLSTPVMLGVGYYILRQSLAIKLFHTALILGFFLLMVPHQVLAQAFIMQHLSVLFMPVLYICFGAVFDALVFVALYSWAVSDAPMDATT